MDEGDGVCGRGPPQYVQKGSADRDGIEDLKCELQEGPWFLTTPWFSQGSEEEGEEDEAESKADDPYAHLSKKEKKKLKKQVTAWIPSG